MVHTTVAPAETVSDPTQAFAFAPALLPVEFELARHREEEGRRLELREKKGCRLQVEEQQRRQQAPQRDKKSAAAPARAATDTLATTAPAAVTAPTEPPDSTAPAKFTVAGEREPQHDGREGLQRWGEVRSSAARTMVFFFPPSTVALERPRDAEGVRRPLKLERE